MSELTLEQFNEAIAQISTSIATIRGEMATKTDLENVRAEMATKTDLKTGLETLQKNLENYTDEVTATVLDSIDTNFQQVRRRLDMRDHRMNKIESEVKELKVALNIA